MTLRALLHFYYEDLPTMPDWQYAPQEHRTRDVVRRVIIPLTCRDESSYAAWLNFAAMFSFTVSSGVKVKPS